MSEERPANESGKYNLRIKSAQGIVIGDHNIVYQTIVRRYPALKDYAYNFSDTIATVTRWFVGRQFIFDTVDAFVAQHPCGYFRLIADAGLGKTAIAAEMVNRYNALAHFNNASRGVTRPDQCLNDLCVQLIARYDLPYDHLPERAGQDAAFLSTLLGEARQKHPPDQSIVLVVDALDEADPVPPGHNWLHLPDSLPAGVYIVLTQRPGSYPLATDARTPMEELTIAWDDPHQQQDIAAHLRRQATESEEISRALATAAPPIPVERFIAALQEASQGNFKYLDYVLADIGRHEPDFDPLRLEGLPRGLDGYYEHFWQQMEQVKGEEGWAEWNELYRPVIGLLGVAQEPVPTTWLAAHLGRPAEEIQERALQRWERFLSRERRSGQETWRVVHRSFAEFLAKKLDLPAMHSRVADRYLEAWGGLEANLPALQQPANAALDGGYGLRHLAAHLEQAGRTKDLHRLLATEWPRNVPCANAWYSAHTQVSDTAGYLADIDRAWRLAERSYLPDSSLPPQSPNNLTGSEERGERFTGICHPLALQIRYALIVSSINSWAEHLSPEIIVLLVKNGVWSREQGLTCSRSIPDPARRLAALGELAPLWPQKEQLEIFREALAATPEALEWNIHGNINRELFKHLISQLPEELLPEAWETARSIEHPEIRAQALVDLAHRLPEQLLLGTMNIAQAVEHPSERVQVLVGIAPYLAEPARGQVLLQVLESMMKAAHYIRELVALPLNRELLDSALQMAREIPDLYDRSLVLANLSTKYPLDEGRQILNEALAIMQRERFRLPPRSLFTRISSMEDWVVALSPNITEGLCPYIWPMVQQLPTTREGYSPREQAVVGLAPNLPEKLLDEALRITQEGSGQNHDKVLAALVPRMVELKRFEQALAAAEHIQGEWERHEALLCLCQTQHLSEEFLHQILPTARRIRWYAYRSTVLAHLARCLPEGKDVQVFREALSAARKAPERDYARGGCPRGEALIELAPLLPNDLKHELLLAAKQIRWAEGRTWTLRHLVPHLVSLEERRGALNEIVASVRVTDVGDRNLLLANLVHEMVELGFPDHGIAYAGKVGATSALIKSLAGLMRFLRVNRNTRAFFTAVAALAKADLARGLIQVELAQYIKEPLHSWVIQKAMSAARMVPSVSDDIRATTRLIVRLVQLGYYGQARQALARIRKEWPEPHYAEMLAQMAAYLPEEFLQETVESAQGIKQEGWSEIALKKLIPRMAELGHAEESIARAREIQPALARGVILAGVAGYLQEPLGSRILREAYETLDGWQKSAQLPKDSLVRKRAEAVASAVFSDTEPEGVRLLRKLYEIAVSRLDWLGQTGLLDGLAPHLPFDLLGQALTAAHIITEEENYDSLLTSLARRWAAWPEKEPSYLLWQKNLRNLSRYSRFRLLSDLCVLTGVLAALGGLSAVTEAFHAIQEVGRWWP